MSNVFTAATAVVGIIVLLIAFSLIGGTIVWLAWPSAMLAFPGLVKAGFLVPKIGWWSAVCLSFVCGTLIKASQTKNNK